MDDITNITLDEFFAAKRQPARFVIKLGGEIMLNASGIDSIASQVATLSRSGNGVEVVVVHGGGRRPE